MVRRLLSENSVSTVFELVDVLSESLTWGGLSPVRECRRLIETIGFDAIEWCWSELKRLGRVQGTTRQREWDEMLSACKRARYDSDGDAIMDTVDEYAECVGGPKNEPSVSPVIESQPCEMPVEVFVKAEPEPSLSPVGLVIGNEQISPEDGNELGPTQPVSNVSQDEYVVESVGEPETWIDPV